MTPIAHTTWDTNTVDTNSVYNGIRESSGDQNSAITFWPAVAKGTWDIEVMHRNTTGSGIITVALDGVSQGTIDTYAAATSYNNRTSLTGLEVKTAGKKVLSLTMATKNASSTGYIGGIQHIQLRRTA